MQRVAFVKYLLAFLLPVSCLLAEDQVHLVFYHVDEGYQPYRASIHIDGNVVHKLGNTHRWATDIHPGSHRLYGDRAQYEHEYTFEAGRTYYFRVAMRQGEHVGPFHRGENRTWGFRVIPVPEEVALGDTDGLKSEK